MLDRFALPLRECLHGFPHAARRLGLLDRRFWTCAGIRVLFVVDRRVNLARTFTQYAAHQIDGAPVSNDREPCHERARGVVGVARVVQREQHFLHHVVDPIGRGAAGRRRTDDLRSPCPNRSSARAA